MPSANLLRVGNDVVDLTHVRTRDKSSDERFLARVFTDSERAGIGRAPDPDLDVWCRWAAKEAVVKVLGTGFVKGITFHDVEVLPLHTGQPEIRLTGEAAERAAEQQIDSVLISISHAQLYATATAIGTSCN